MRSCALLSLLTGWGRAEVLALTPEEAAEWLEATLWVEKKRNGG